MCPIHFYHFLKGLQIEWVSYYSEVVLLSEKKCSGCGSTLPLDTCFQPGDPSRGPSQGAQPGLQPRLLELAGGVGGEVSALTTR